jgi:hypothetical protein
VDPEAGVGAVSAAGVVALAAGLASLVFGLVDLGGSPGGRRRRGVVVVPEPPLPLAQTTTRQLVTARTTHTGTLLCTSCHMV